MLQRQRRGGCGSKCRAYRLNELAVVEQCGLVLNVIARYPRLDLVTQSLELLDLCLQICLQLLLLCLVCRRLHLVVYALEELDTFPNLLQGPVNFGYRNSG